MVNYAKGKIYKIVSDQTDKIYIGSTCQTLCKRFSCHRGNYKDYLNGKQSYCASYEIIKYDDAKIYLIEDYPCERREQLLRREGEIIKKKKNNGGCCNNKIAGRTKKEWKTDNRDIILEKNKQYKIDNRDKILQYYQDNKDYILEKNHKYYEDNKDQVLNHQKEYYENNKDKISEQKKQYSKDNKDKIKARRSQKYTCEVCDKELLKDHKARHEKSEAHLRNL